MGSSNDWLRQAIGQGFMMLSSLNLKGRPAAADLKAVAQVWYGLLLKHEWQPERDRERIQAAFENIAVNQTEWPNPADLMKHLPPLPVVLNPRKLEAKHIQTAFGHEQIAALKQYLRNAPCMKQDWIHGQPHRSVDECKRIYAARQKEKEK